MKHHCLKMHTWIDHLTNQSVCEYICIMFAPMKIIRKHVLGMTQVELAALTQVGQATVSRWENGELEPDRQQMATIREAVIAQGKPWKDEWFFDASEVLPPFSAEGEAA